MLLTISKFSIDANKAHLHTVQPVGSWVRWKFQHYEVKLREHHDKSNHLYKEEEKKNLSDSFLIIKDNEDDISVASVILMEIKFTLNIKNVRQYKDAWLNILN